MIQLNDRRRDRHGAIFITALGIIVILTGLLLAFAQQMRTEALAAANRLSYAQADAIERGAEAWVLAQVESSRPDAIILTQTNAEAIPVGDGHFWLLQPNSTSDSTYTYGLVDEASKLNLNTSSAKRLQNLPNMTQAIADAIQDWRSPAGSATSDGAESSYYQGVQPPFEGYSAKNAAYETVEELLLVRDVTPQLLHGSDLNQDGVISDRESRLGGGLGTSFGNSNFTTRGWFNDLTVYTNEPNTTAAGVKRANVNDPNGVALQKVLTESISAARATAIIARIRPPGRRPSAQFPNIGAFYIASGMTADEFKKVVDQITTSAAANVQGLVNVNTAPREVLMCLNGLTDSDADALIAQRQNANSTNIGWVFSTLATPKAAAISGQITARSYQYTADIVAVAGDGRSFKRVRIGVDALSLPARIVYRRELTSLGWPLPAALHDELRHRSAGAS